MDPHKWNWGGVNIYSGVLQCRSEMCQGAPTNIHGVHPVLLGPGSVSRPIFKKNLIHILLKKREGSTKIEAMAGISATSPRSFAKRWYML
jgi:hypothetical protein